MTTEYQLTSYACIDDARFANLDSDLMLKLRNLFEGEAFTLVTLDTCHPKFSEDRLVSNGLTDAPVRFLHVSPTGVCTPVPPTLLLAPNLVLLGTLPNFTALGLDAIVRTNYRVTRVFHLFFTAYSPGAAPSHDIQITTDDDLGITAVIHSHDPTRYLYRNELFAAAARPVPILRFSLPEAQPAPYLHPSLSLTLCVLTDRQPPLLPVQLDSLIATYVHCYSLNYDQAYSATPSNEALLRAYASSLGLHYEAIRTMYRLAAYRPSELNMHTSQLLYAIRSTSQFTFTVHSESTVSYPSRGVHVYAYNDLCCFFPPLLGGTGATNEVPRRQAYRLKLLRAAAPYLDLDEQQVQQLSAVRNWSPELVHRLKRALCPENVACYNVMFGQEYPQLAPDYKSPLALGRYDHQKATTHLAVEHRLYIDECILQPNPPASLKEYLHPSYGWTEQFKSERPFQSLFPSHQASDYATRKWSMEHRLRFLHRDEKLKKFNDNTRKALGSTLFINFQRYLQLTPRPFDEAEFFDCITENTNNRLNKPLHNLFNIRERGDLGNDFHFIDLFLKSQICKKLEKMYKFAKPGQMIVNFHVIIIILFGPVVRYLHRQIERDVAASGVPIYFHGGRSSEELNAFVAKHLDPEALATTNDFTLFDQSQDVEFLHFQLNLMKFYAIPDFFLDFYYNYKMNLQSKYGPLSVMIFSGEPCTWHFNTYDNLAWHVTLFLIPAHVPAMISGDDSLFGAELVERRDNKKLRRLFTLQAKTELTRRPVFCGWICYGRHGIVKHPQLIYIRLRIAMERGNLQDVIQSYAEESQYAYALGDALHDILDPFNLAVQQILNRFFVKNLDSVAKANRYHLE